uniref:KIB1-4 beta-propeller domain-containing protein n=1 Tax=Musa acuminata subsp. malaccensis TaxID=214687 RepID=A0A804KPH9_MUSAM
RATCKDWCSALLPVVIPSPWLLLVGKNSDTCNFLSLPTRRSFTYSLLPELRGVQYVGSQAGWLAVFNKNLDVSLINPLTAARICLPSFLTLPNFELVDGSCEIAYAKAGGDKWNLLQTTSTQHRSYEDIMYHNGKFYCITVEAEVFAFDLSGVSPTVTVVAESTSLGLTHFDYHIPCSRVRHIHSKYLACSSTGELFLILRHAVLSYESLGWKAIMVWRYNPQRQPCWEAVKNLGNKSLLIGINNAISISTENFRGARRDCVYFTEAPVRTRVNGRPEIIHSIVVSDVERGKWARARANSQLQPHLLPPIWFTPSML